MRGKFAVGEDNQPVHKSFNEARALCAGSSNHYDLHGGLQPRFNEARALCAGSSRSPSARSATRLRFNEARALCAGS